MSLTLMSATLKATSKSCNELLSGLRKHAMRIQRDVSVNGCSCHMVVARWTRYSPQWIWILKTAEKLMDLLLEQCILRQPLANNLHTKITASVLLKDEVQSPV